MRVLGKQKGDTMNELLKMLNEGKFQHGLKDGDTITIESVEKVLKDFAKAADGRVGKTMVSRDDYDNLKKDYDNIKKTYDEKIDTETTSQVQKLWKENNGKDNMIKYEMENIKKLKTDEEKLAYIQKIQKETPDLFTKVQVNTDGVKSTTSIGEVETETPQATGTHGNTAGV